jgi:hypothetical protein
MTRHFGSTGFRKPCPRDRLGEICGQRARKPQGKTSSTARAAQAAAVTPAFECHRTNSPITARSNLAAMRPAPGTPENIRVRLRKRELNPAAMGPASKSQENQPTNLNFTVGCRRRPIATPTPDTFLGRAGARRDFGTCQPLVPDFVYPRGEIFWPCGPQGQNAEHCRQRYTKFSPNSCPACSGLSHQNSVYVPGRPGRR